MKPRFAARVRVRVALQSACLIAVAVGIFGMNALGNCGMPDMLGMSSMTPTSINQSADGSASSTHGQTADSALASTESRTVTGKSVQAGPVEEDGGMGVVGWCLAALVTGLGVVMYLARRRLRRPSWLLPRFENLFAIIERVGRPLPAPSLSQLSILRC